MPLRPGASFQSGDRIVVLSCGRFEERCLYHVNRHASGRPLAACDTAPVLLNPENALFVRGTTPVLLLADVPVHDALPPLTSPDGTVPPCEGWSILPKLTRCVLAGPGEAFEAKNPLEPTGKVTGRPVLHLEDLVVALRLTEPGRDGGGGRQGFGCSIDPSSDAMAKVHQAMQDHANAARGVRMKAMAEAMGVQRVSTFGAPADSRLEFVTVAADYRLKRMFLGAQLVDWLFIRRAQRDSLYRTLRRFAIELAAERELP